MKMRTLLAGIVAAATMLGGMAAVATSAQAAGVTITVNNSQSGHTYTPYKFANLKVDANDSSKVEVTTVEGWSDAVKTAAGLGAAGNATDADKKLYASNPAAYVATFDAAQLREFAKKLSATGKTADGNATSGTDGQSASIPVFGEGWYLVTDSFTTKDGKTTTGVNAIVATTINGHTGDFKVVGDAGTGQGNIKASGQFNAKNDAPQPPTKEVKLGTVDVNGKSASVGDTLEYTITAPVPANAAGFDEYAFTVTDTASKGLQVTSAGYKITDAAGNDITGLFTITPSGDTAHGTTTTFTVTDPTKTPTYAGQNLVITYAAKVTAYAIADGSVYNSATITTKNGTSGIGTTKVYNYGFSLTKKDKDGANLKGAVFQLYDQSGNSPIGSTVSTGDNGDAAWSGLAAGTYTVKETKAPAGYSQQFLPTFKVTITQNQNDPAKATVTIEEGDTFGLATESNGNITVLNVKNASQLPLTGAAGTVMFTVVALLVAAAGVTLAVKSRQRVH